MTKNTPSNVQGVGTDIVEIERIRSAYQRHGERFLRRVFTPEERNYCTSCADPTPRLAGRFAAKEAIAKTFGTGIGADIEWKEIEIVNDSRGKPEVMLSPRLRRLFPNINILLSISHCRAYATAVAIMMDHSKEFYGTS